MMSSASVNSTSSEFTLTDLEIGILCTVNAVFSIVGSFGNILICFAFLRFAKLRNTTNIFILSLACSALLVCLLAQPMYAVSLVKHYQQEYITNVFETIRKCFSWISLLASAGNLFGVTLDRYYAINKPFRYSEGGRLNAYIFVAVVWFIAFALGTTAVFKATVRMVILIYVFVIVICLILPLYARILHIAAKQRQKILASKSLTSKYSVQDQSNPSPHSKHRLNLLHIKIDRSALITVGVICAVFVLGWFPLLILPLVLRFIKEDRLLILDVFQWANTMALCSSACNPMVYAATDRRFRNSIKVTYRRWATRRKDLAAIPRKSYPSSKRSLESS